MAAELKFEAPNQGPWELDSAHFDRPFPRYGRDWFAQGFEKGQALSMERVGAPVKGIRVAFINGFFYMQLVPLVGEPKAGAKLPPRWLFRLMSALHPVIRKRAAVAKRWVDGRGWRDDVQRWDNEVKPALTKRLEALQAEDPRELSDGALIAHLERAGDLIGDNLVAHFDTNPTAIYPVGLFVSYVREWTGANAAEIISVVSTGARAPGDAALAALAKALRASSDASSLLAGNDAARILDELRTRGDEIGDAARAWLAHVEPRQISSGDLSLPTGGECPELLVEHIRHAYAHDRETKTRVGSAADLRARVPEDKRARFDELLEEARFVHRLRDERSTHLDCWVMGLGRRALIEGGRRLAERGLLHATADVVELDHDELTALLTGGEGPSAEAIAERVRQRATLRIEDAPELLGTDKREEPPPLDYFDATTGSIIRAMFEYIEHMDRDGPEPEAPEAALIRGLPASGGKYRGPVRIVTNPDQFGNVRPGDVLVARATMPAYNVLLPIVGAIVTDKGGALCHAAIVSREYGLPGVVGTRDATTQLSDGMIVEVDGDAGTVEVVQ